MHRPVDETAEAIFRETCMQIATHVRAVIEEINNQPVYTIHEMLEGKRLNPTSPLCGRRTGRTPGGGTGTTPEL